MLQPYRDRFNAQFTPAKYDDLLARLSRHCRTDIERCSREKDSPCRSVRHWDRLRFGGRRTCIR